METLTTRHSIIKTHTQLQTQALPEEITQLVDYAVALSILEKTIKAKLDEAKEKIKDFVTVAQTLNNSIVQKDGPKSVVIKTAEHSATISSVAATLRALDMREIKAAPEPVAVLYEVKTTYVPVDGWKEILGDLGEDEQHQVYDAPVWTTGQTRVLLK